MNWPLWIGLGLGTLAVLGGAARDLASAPLGPQPTIKLGSVGPAVATWQKICGASPTGTFDAATDAKTRQWQSQRGLTADGVVGPATWKAAGLQGSPAGGGLSPSPTSPGASPAASAASANVPIPTGVSVPSDVFALSESIPEREKQIMAAVAAGMVDHHWWPLELSRAGRTCKILVSRRALALSQGGQRLVVSLSYNAQQGVASMLGARMLTSRISDEIWKQASTRLTPITRPWSQDGTMAKTSRMREQSAAVDAAVAGASGLVANEGKDWVITKRFWSEPAKRHNSANFGWYGAGSSKSPGGLQVIQSIGLAHDRQHVDYSQLCRFVRTEVLVDGAATSYRDVLTDPELAPLLSDEGPLPDDAHPDLAGVA